ncbi:hypothetical protein A2823_01570 [Candidatus Nomurabacteria bacterium RIFCSPHIGHO2_01_FULL_41_91]|uniref:GIY-YIG domain-containing protein n=1 Tax=Candidatus Nomurabacteria bacterium RIFCSPLOWO2_12_FULL_41_10 TaxID=1801795 RepID=A0A1F6YA14_9BACT|nr:MAG: hypothetical protein A2823_01570 [Candidatus Nomurabacteria bacterium RIFCSPHIGHO2_01_FULL_41_91]OGI80679.1 MAG: hypothetical protein A3D43_00950 [Candidatus Nomurabacteria bacterium RIFCSPHIGHO2_02_FULL_41_52]OGI84953.1 MAG: hypothetical protein A3F49_00340 [Candidatus Nomurabacteria bacterium RIFCSPHIGHO2_12_FULL_42_19]OGI93769.1 MAG: hypothetical protein A3A07_03025 [Candidatus Nomurabacteria bacterium RIFCSPLOWO2_01_FULL_41_52]OGI98048.1 MAG: hypothetical protein A3H56_02730 [Candid
MHKLSQSTIEKLGYYVYLLSDPRTEKIFYVGKGHGNRINHHLLGALEENTKESDKIKTIRKIQSAGLEVGLTILRHGLTEKEAFEIESSVIDLIGMKNLTNLVLGHYSLERGKMMLKNIEIEYEAEEAVFTDRAMLIRINKLYRYDMSDKELYEATRKYWIINSWRARISPIICAVYAGIIREVYMVRAWIPPSPKTPRRWSFVGAIAPEDIREKYIDKSVKHLFKKGSQNPIRYVG